jgi:hypothetical protein
MSADDTTTSIQQLIDTCREQLANTGEGILYLEWLPYDGDIFESGVCLATRDYITSIYITTDSDKRQEGAVTISRIPESWVYFGTKDDTRHEIDCFNYISRLAGTLVISHWRLELQPYLYNRGQDEADIRGWWIAYLFHHDELIPHGDQPGKITFFNVLTRTLLALEQFKAENLKTPLTFDECVPISKAVFHKLIGLTDKTVKEKARQGKLPIHPDFLKPGNSENLYWVEREYLSNLKRYNKSIEP